MDKERMSIPSSLILLLALAGWSPDAGATLRGNAVVTGRVTNAASQPIPGATVSVEVVGSIYNAAFYPFFWGQRQIVSTQFDGTYQAVVGVPSEIPPRNLYARIVVAQLSGSPIYGSQVDAVPLTGVGTFQKDFTLSTLPYGVFVRGTIRDAQTGKRLNGGAFTGGSGGWYTVADGEGEFFGTFPLSAPTQTRTIAISRRDDVAGNGISYLPQTNSITFVSGQTQVLNGALQRDESRPTVIGRLIDGTTGTSIRSALVRTTQGTPCVVICSPGSGLFYRFAVTDDFGRYAVSVQTPNYFVLETNGAFRRIGDNVAPSLAQRIDLSGRLMDGQVFIQDFSMVPAAPRDDAAFVTQTVPTALQRGQTAQVRVTMRNAGTTTWESNSTTYTAYHLGSQHPQGNTVWGINRADVPLGLRILPDQTYEFVFTIAAPATPGTYVFQWKMIRETLGVWNAFGQLTPAIFITVK